MRRSQTPFCVSRLDSQMGKAGMGKAAGPRQHQPSAVLQANQSWDLVQPSCRAEASTLMRCALLCCS